MRSIIDHRLFPDDCSLLPDAFLSRGPRHLPPTQQMQMQMRHFLSAVWAAIEYQSVAVPERLGCSQRFSYNEQVPNQVDIPLLNLVITLDRLSRDNQNVSRCLGINVANREAPFILVNKITRDITAGNSLKKCLLRHRDWI